MQNLSKYDSSQDKDNILKYIKSENFTQELKRLSSTQLLDSWRKLQYKKVPILNAMHIDHI